MPPAADLDTAIVALVRRHGRQGINEAAVWTMLRAQQPTLDIADSAAALDRLVTAGRIYRHLLRRRGHVILHAVPDSPKAMPPAVVVPPASLFDGGGL